MSENTEPEVNQKPKAEESWQKWEPVVHEILGGTSGRFSDDRSAEKRNADDNKENTNGGVEYFDRNGKKVLNPKDLPANDPVLSLQTDASGSRTLKVFADKAGFQVKKELFSENFSYAQDGSKTIEERKIKTADSAETQLQTIFDKDTSEISFRIKSDGLKQEIGLDGNSKPQKFEISYGDNLLSYQIEDGKFSGVKMTGPDGTNRPLSAEKTAEFISAANQSVESLRLNNGIPEPLNFDAVRNTNFKPDAITAQSPEIRTDFRLNDAVISTKSGELNITEDAYKRREIITPELFKSLLSDAKTSDVAKSILVDLSTPDYFGADPLSTAIRTLKEQHPEKRESLGTAAIESLQQNSKNPLHVAMGKAAAEDPLFADKLRQIIGSDLQSKRADAKGPAVDLLMSMSAQWTSADFNAALQNMQPDQVRAFRAALTQAPMEVKLEAARIATMNQGEQNLDLFRPQIDLGSSLNKMTDENFRSTQDRMRLILGRNESGESLLPLPLGSRLDQRTRDKPLSIFEKQPSLLDFSVPGKDREDNHVRDLFRSAFPQHEMGLERRPPKLDTRYLADSLTAHSLDRTGTPQTADNVFSKWGIDSEKFADKINTAKTQYGQENILALDRRVQMFNALDPSLRERIAGAGNGDRIDEGKLAGLMLNGRLGQSESPYKFLLDSPPIEQKLKQETGTASSELRLSELTLQDKRAAKDVSLSLLSQYTSDGVSAGALVTHGLDKTFEAVVAIPTLGLAPKTELFTSGVEAFAKKQGELVNEFRANDQAFKDKVQENAKLASSEAQLRFAKTVLDYESLAQSATPQLRKDYMALSLVDHYGMDVIKDKAPRVWQDLQDGGLKRLLDQHLIQSDKFDEIKGNRGERLQKAFDISDSLRQHDTGNLDVGIRRRQVLDVVDTDPSLNEAQKQFSKFGQEFATFSQLFESANNGTKYEGIVKDLKTQAKELEQVISQVKREDLNNLIDLQIKTDAASKSATDPETRAALEERAASMKGVLDILNPESPQNQSLLKTLRDAQTRSFSEDTLGTWMADNGPVIAAAAVSVSITMATMGTGAPIAAVLMSSAVALGATQFTSEALYQINHNLGDTGFGAYNSRSYAGAWAANNVESFNRLLAAQDWKGTSAEAQALITSYVKEVSTPLTQEYAQNVVMGLVGLGALKIGQSGISSLNSQWVKSLVTNPQSLEMIEMAGKAGMNSSSKAAASAWIRQMAKESAKEIGEEVSQEGVTTVAERALQQAKLNSPLASVLLAVSMGMAQGRLGSHHDAKFSSNNDLQIHPSMRDSVLENLKNSGHSVEKMPDGSYKVSNYKTPGSELRISLTDDVHSTAPRSQSDSNNKRQTSPSSESTNVQSPEGETSRRQHRRQGLGVENETDLKIQDKADQLEFASAEEAAKLKGEIKELLVEKAKEYARKFGLVTRDANNQVVDYMISEKNIRLSEDGYDDSYGSDNVIEINLNRADPTSALRHEMKHMSEMLERTSLEKADPAMFDRRVREDVFGDVAQGGFSRIAVVDGELQSVSRTELKTAEQRNALKSLLMEFSDTNSSAKPEQIAKWLQDKPERMELFAKQGLDSAALTNLMSAEMFHYQSVKRHLQLDSSVLQNDAKLDQWTTARAENYRRKAEERNSTLYDEPQLKKMTRNVTDEVLGTVGDAEHYNVFGPSERRAENIELTSAINALRADPDSQGIVNTNLSVIQHNANLQKLSSSIAKMRTEGEYPEALQDARDAASKLIDKLPDNELGRKVAARLIDLKIIDAEQVPSSLRPRSDGSESRPRIADGSSEGDVKRQFSHENPFTKELMDAAKEKGFVGRDSAEDIKLLREFLLVRGQKNDLDEIDPENRTEQENQDYEIIMAKMRAHSALKLAVDTEIAKLSSIEAVEQKNLPDSSQGGFATQKKMTPWIKDLFAGDPRYKILGGGASSDHAFLDIGLFDTQTGQYLPIDVKQYDPAERDNKPLPSLVRLALSNPHDKDVQGLAKESAKDESERRQKVFFQDLAGVRRDTSSTLIQSMGDARSSLLKSLHASPLTVLHTPLDLRNHLSSENLKHQKMEEMIRSLASLPPGMRHDATVKLEKELTAQKQSVEKFVRDLETQAKASNDPRISQYVSAFKYKVERGGYFDKHLLPLRRAIAQHDAPVAAVPTPSRNTSGATEPVRPVNRNAAGTTETTRPAPIEVSKPVTIAPKNLESAKPVQAPPVETPISAARKKTLDAVSERLKFYEIDVKDPTAHNPDIKEVLKEIIEETTGSSERMRLEDGLKLYDGYVAGNPAGIEAVNAYLAKIEKLQDSSGK